MNINCQIEKKLPDVRILHSIADDDQLLYVRSSDCYHRINLSQSVVASLRWATHKHEQFDIQHINVGWQLIKPSISIFTINQLPEDDVEIQTEGRI